MPAAIPRLRLPLALLVLLALGCGRQPPHDSAAGEPPAATPDADVATTGEPAADGWQECTNEHGGFVVAYPRGWVVNDGSVVPACSLFDPAPFDVPPESEVPEDIAVSIHVADEAFETIAGSDFALRELEREEGQVAGRRAVVRLFEHTGEGLFDRGMRTQEYVVDWGGGRTLVAHSHSAGEPPFEQKRQVLAEMMQRLRPR